MRIVENELGIRPDIQYRYMFLITDAYTGVVHKKGEIWSEWKTAPYVKLEEIKNETQN